MICCFYNTIVTRSCFLLVYSGTITYTFLSIRAGITSTLFYKGNIDYNNKRDRQCNNIIVSIMINEKQKKQVVPKGTGSDEVAKNK